MTESKLSSIATQKEAAIFLRLYRSLDWMQNKHEAIATLQSYCKSDSHYKILNYLFERMIVLHGPTFDEAAQHITEEIINYCENNSINHRVIPHDFGETSGSSNVIYEKLRVCFADHPEWGSSTIFSRSISETLNNRNVESISLVDDFVGTGNKVQKLLDWIQAKRADIKVDIVSCVAMNEGFSRSYTNSVFRRIKCWKRLDKAISDISDPQLAGSFRSAMEELESSHGNIDKKISFGYEQSESAYGAIDWSTPDNTFPIFWLKSPSSTKTLFTRARK